MDFEYHIMRDAVSLLCMRLIGEGMSRKVYSCTLNPSKWVVKVEETEGCFQNVMEYEVWRRAEWAPGDVSKWLAPVINISDNGRVLVMAKTTPCPTGMLPDKVPAFLTDFKPNNWGLYEGRPVCHDYGTSLAIDKGMSMRMKKADFTGYT